MPKESGFDQKLKEAREEVSSKLDASDPEQVGAKITLEKIGESQVWKIATDAELAEWAFNQIYDQDFSSLKFETYSKKLIEAYKNRALSKGEVLQSEPKIAIITHETFHLFWKKDFRKKVVEKAISQLLDIKEPTQVVGAIDRILTLQEHPNLDLISQQEVKQLNDAIKDILDLNLMAILKEGKDPISREMLQEKLEQTIFVLRNLIS